MIKIRSPGRRALRTVEVVRIIHILGGVNRHDRRAAAAKFVPTSVPVRVIGVSLREYRHFAEGCIARQFAEWRSKRRRATWGLMNWRVA